MNRVSRAIYYWIDCIIDWKSDRIYEKTVKSTLKRNRMLKKNFPRVIQRLERKEIYKILKNDKSFKEIRREASIKFKHSRQTFKKIIYCGSLGERSRESPPSRRVLVFIKVSDGLYIQFMLLLYEQSIIHQVFQSIINLN